MKNISKSVVYQINFNVLGILLLLLFSSSTFGAKVSRPTMSPGGATYTLPQSITIATSTSGATIRYTTDNTTPSQTNGIIYIGPVTINFTSTLKAIAYKTGMDDSDIKSENYTISKTIAPTMSPDAGAYSSPQSITLVSLTLGASIRYTLDGSTPSSTVGTVYSAPISVAANVTIKAIAYKTGITNSDITTGIYTISCAIPAFSLLPGTYNSTQSLSLSSTTSEASIRYTTDGSTPSSTNGTIYTSAISVSSNITLKAIAYKTGMNNSSVISGVYSIKCASPVYSPIAGNYNASQTLTISSSTIGASIRYTTDGSNPSQTNGTLYSSSFVVSSTSTVKAITYKNGNLDSDISTSEYIIQLPYVATPVFSPEAGTYDTPKSITISSPTTGASIKYTTDGSTPSPTNGTAYNSAISISTNQTLKAIAYKFDMNNSVVVSGVYSIKCAIPVYSPVPGNYDASQSITISSSTSGASIRYTTDGSDPSQTNGTLYSTPFTVASSSIVKAIAYKTGNLNSDIFIGQYIIQEPIVGAPVFSPDGGTYETSKIITISSPTTGASIRYTTDGSTPSSTIGTIYSSPISISSNLSLKAIAYKTAMTNSSVTTAVYSIKCASPVFSPIAGNYNATQTLTITGTTSGASIRYTTDGTNPSQTNGTLYSTSFVVSSSVTVKAIAYKTGNLDSDISIGQYVIQFPIVGTPVFSPVAGTYSTPKTVTISSPTTGASIRYTTDGSAPNTSTSALYVSPIQMNTSGTLKAIAYKSAMTDSPVASAIYVIQSPDTDGDGVIDAEDDYPLDATRAFNIQYPAKGFGSLAFEDLWPSKGDFDFNDLVVNYSFKIITNAQNNVIEIKSKFHVVAAGAGLKNGFGFQFDNITPDKITSVTGQSNSGSYINLSSNGTENNQAKAVIIAIDNIDNVLHRVGGSMFNTVNNGFHGTADTVNISIIFKEPILLASIGNPPFNPFLIKGLVRSTEIHLADRMPTSLVNSALFKTLDDDSNPAIDRYYKTANNLPWAINIPEPFFYPYEKTEITEAYLYFAEWAESSGVSFSDWYQNKNGYRDINKIYQ